MHRIVLASLTAVAIGVQPSAAQVVNVWPGTAPGSERWTQQERTFRDTPVGTVIQDVVQPTITAYLPDPARATGTGIVIAPGGAFVALAISQEGTDVARWLQQRGIAAFVLKYRTIEKRQDGVPAMDMDTAARYGIADGIQALGVVRANASAWRVSPDRIGFLGFSAGAMVVSGALLRSDAIDRPSFAALVYGAPFGVMPAIPSRLPPTFLSWAEDDAIARGAMTRFRDALRAAGNSPRIQVLGAGGHGFGMRKQGTPSDHWIDTFYSWLQSQGLTTAATGAASVHDRFVLQSAALGETRPINVYLPPQYRLPTAAHTRFPVLYMPDGGVDEDFPHVVNTVDSLIALRRIRPVIVVGVPNTQRRRDLTGPTRVKSDSAIAPRVGGSAALRRFLASELMPEIARRYRVTHERGVAGESLAGMFIVETFLREPALFTHYVAFDPSVWWDHGSLVDSAAALPGSHDGMTQRTIYLASSEEPSSAIGTARLVASLQKSRPKKLRWRYEPRPDLTHGNIFLTLAPAALADALR